MIDFLNTNELPQLIKIAIGHYYFGYIHPFYDGNGRTSRFISSVYLYRELSSLTAISLSKGCNHMKGKYYEAFELLNSVSNRGEVNCFVEVFLTIILKEQNKMVLDIKMKQELLDGFFRKLSESEITRDNELLSNIAFVLGQVYFFGMNDEGLQVKELVEILDSTDKKIRTALKILLEEKIVYAEGTKPAHYMICEEFLNQ